MHFRRNLSVHVCIYTVIPSCLHLPVSGMNAGKESRSGKAGLIGWLSPQSGVVIPFYHHLWPLCAIMTRKRSINRVGMGLSCFVFAGT
ncbi:hypothetical protein BDV18DRAFT_37341 [Aspergillus unguis]